MVSTDLIPSPSVFPHDVENLIRKHAILNALDHTGKASSKAVLGSVLSEDVSLKARVKELIPIVNKIIEEVNSESRNILEQKAIALGLSSERAGRPPAKVTQEPERLLPELPGATLGQVVMRLAPYPSGPLHIGNARMVILNDEYAKKYDGKLILAFDDTIGSEEKFVIPEAYDMIKHSIEWLGVRYSNVVYKSDRIPISYEYSEKLIRMDLAYVCLCKSNELRENRRLGKPCVHRSQTVAQNLELWQGMLAGRFREGEATLRVKTSMNHPNPAFRDRVLCRVVDREHPRVGAKYLVWPLLEFSWAIDDHLLGMTHILRGKDLVIEDMMEDYIWEKFQWKKAHFVHYGLLNVEEAKLSKTASRKAIESGEYFGWDDPRTWSLQSLEKRGIQAEALRRFVLLMGMSLADVSVPAEILYSENRKIIDPIALRYFGVRDPLKLKVSSVSEKFKTIKVDLHPDFPNYGTREIPVNSDEIFIEKLDYERFRGESIRLMDLFNVKLGTAGKYYVSASYISKEVVRDIPKLHWVSSPNYVAEAIMTDGWKLRYITEPALEKAKPGQIVQLVRVGFFRVDTSKILYFAHK